MFTLKESNDFEWPVTVKVPVSGGKFRSQRFTAVFRPIPAQTLEEINKLSVLEQDAAQAREFLVGWGDDVKGEDGEPLEFTEEYRDAMLDIVYVRSALVRAYWDAMTGKKAATKN